MRPAQREGGKGKGERKRPAVASPCRTSLVSLRTLGLILRTMVRFKYRVTISCFVKSILAAVPSIASRGL